MLIDGLTHHFLPGLLNSLFVKLRFDMVLLHEDLKDIIEFSIVFLDLLHNSETTKVRSNSSLHGKILLLGEFCYSPALHLHNLSGDIQLRKKTRNLLCRSIRNDHLAVFLS